MFVTGFFRKFLAQENGAVTVDWVVLGAACVSMGLGVTNVVKTEMRQLTYDIRATLHQDLRDNPFDVETQCTYLFLDPAADPALLVGLDEEYVGSCSVSPSTDSGATPPDTSYTAIITDDAAMTSIE